MLSARQMIVEIRDEVTEYKTLAGIPANQQQNVRNDMYVDRRSAPPDGQVRQAELYLG